RSRRPRRAVRAARARGARRPAWRPGPPRDGGRRPPAGTPRGRAGWARPGGRPSPRRGSGPTRRRARPRPRPACRPRPGPPDGTGTAGGSAPAPARPSSPSSPCVACVVWSAGLRRRLHGDLGRVFRITPGPRGARALSGRRRSGAARSGIPGLADRKGSRLEVLEGAAVGRATQGRLRPAGARAVHLGHDLGRVGAAAGQRVAGQLLAVGLVDQAAEGVLHLLEGLAREGVHGEDDLVDVDRDAGQVDEDGLVVAALADPADEVVTGVAHGSVVAHEVTEEDDVDRLLVREQDGGGVQVDLPGARAEQAATGSRLPAETHAHRGQAAAVVLLQTDGLTLGHVDGHALIPLSDVPCCRESRGCREPYAGALTVTYPGAHFVSVLQHSPCPAAAGGTAGAPAAFRRGPAPSRAGQDRPASRICRSSFFISETSSRSRAAISNWRSAAAAR